MKSQVKPVTKRNMNLLRRFKNPEYVTANNTQTLRDRLMKIRKEKNKQMTYRRPRPILGFAGGKHRKTRKHRK